MAKIKYILIFLSLFLLIFICFFLSTNCKNNDLSSNKYPGANVILILIDTLRADHLGCYGYSRNTSPEIDKLANEGIIFKNMLAQTSWTLPGTASILSGLYPKNHGANTSKDRLSEEINLLSEILGKHGYHSYAFVGNLYVTPVFGFDQGYKKFFSFPDLNLHTTSDKINDLLLKFIQQLEDTSNNFIYVHYVDPHAPYIPKEKHFSKSNKGIFSIDFFRSKAIYNMSEEMRSRVIEEMINAYDDEILFNDKMIGNLLQALKKKNMYSNSLIIITSDHGEEFFEHEGLQHGRTLYEEQLNVPLIIHLPDKVHRPIYKIANQVDIYPTILSLLGIPIPEYIDGINLLNNKKHTKPYSYAELYKDRFVFSSIQTSKDKLIERNNLPPKEKNKYRWFKKKADIETGEDSLQLIISSLYKDRTIQVLSDGNPIDEFVITPESKMFNIALPKLNRKKIVTIRSLTPCQVPKNLGINQDTRCLAFRIFDSKNVNDKNLLGELYNEYYSLTNDPGERNNQYNHNKSKKIIILLRKKLREYLLNKSFIPSIKKPIYFNKEQLKALKALGYI
jgi:arylsulfatase A-like enzyme